MFEVSSIWPKDYVEMASDGRTDEAETICLFFETNGKQEDYDGSIRSHEYWAVQVNNEYKYQTPKFKAKWLSKREDSRL